MGKSAWQDTINDEGMRDLLRAYGVQSMHVKFLKRNHNSKNQVYLAKDLTDLPMLKMGEVTTVAGSSRKRKAGPPIYRAPVPWVWVSPGGCIPAPHTKAIYYPQYPEVRLSGFLRGADGAPNELMSVESRGQEAGRVLVFGTGRDDRVYGLVLSRHASATKALEQLFVEGQHLLTLPVDPQKNTDSRSSLLHELARIHKEGWHAAVQLPASGRIAPCRGPRCVGHTLEAQLGITLNGAPSPDFGDWEVKAHSVASFERPSSGSITLFTPEPDLGLYSIHKSDWFVRKYGVPTEDGQRYNFTGIHRVSADIHPKTQLKLILHRPLADLSTDGYIGLATENGELVSGWTFAKLLKHWHTKHSRAAYVPAQSDKLKPPQFKYGNRIHLAEGTRFDLFLDAVSAGRVYYDPGIKSELDENGTWKSKARNQFRIKVRDLPCLYEDIKEVNLLEELIAGLLKN